MSEDSEMVMLSALQHYLFCPRQCALIHVEGVWSENYLTSSGRRMHERVDSGQRETRRGVHTAASLRLLSNRLNIMGVADSVEFHLVESSCDEHGTQRAARLPDHDGYWRPVPVEYKRGKPKAHRADEVQLCAQALCLEEMLGVTIPEGALFYGEPRRRTVVVFDDELRRLTEDTSRAVRSLITSGMTPPVVRTKGCETCSLKAYCMEGKVSARQWIEGVLAKPLEC